MKKAKQVGDSREEEDCEDKEDEEGQEQMEHGGLEEEEQEQIVDNLSEGPESAKDQERPQADGSADGLALPDWIRCPFKSRSSRSGSQDDNNSQME